jgi:hypothetical protein
MATYRPTNGGGEVIDMAFHREMLQGMGTSSCAHLTSELGISGEAGHSFSHTVDITLRHEETGAGMNHHTRDTRVQGGNHR